MSPKKAAEMTKELKTCFKGHVLLMGFPAQGHTNPVLQFAKRLASRGLKATLATTVHFFNTSHIKDCNVGIETISDGYDETGQSGAEDWLAYLNSFREVGSRTLSDIIRKYNCSEDTSMGERITCLVIDAIIPWGLDVGKEFGLVTACFYTQGCSVSSIFYHITQGKLNLPVEEPVTSLPGLPSLAPQDMPSCVVVLETEPANALEMLSNQFSNLDNADWLLFNTFNSLESEALRLMRELWRVITIGPTTSSMYLDKRVEGDTGNSLNMFKPSDEDTYMKWLDAKESGSVLYISFGSIAELGEEQMEELICGIKQSNKDFLWVLREKEQCKLPAWFSEEMVDKGLLVSWCSQLEVLGHDAVGCFLTHCGWNSTIEALSLGVPMVAMPQIWDQFTNAKFVEDVWGLGLRVKKDDNGIVRREEVELCIREVMEGERGKVIKMNAKRFRDEAKDAVDTGGSSDLNIAEFVECVKCT